MSGLLELEGIHARDIGTVLAPVLAASRRPATEILQRFSGTTLHIQVLASGERHLTDRERYRLHAEALLMCRYRNGLLVTDTGLVAASCSLVWLPARLPHDTCRELDEGTRPAGTILAPLGVRREDRLAMPTDRDDEITGEPRATASSAVLVVEGQRVAVAEEFVMLKFAEMLA
jgi:chorismate-pyruvate lyase